MAGNNNQSDTENANSEIRKAHFIVQHGDGDDDEAGSEISFLTLSNKGIHAEGIFLNLGHPGGGVTFVEEIVAGRARVGRRGGDPMEKIRVGIRGVS